MSDCSRGNQNSGRRHDLLANTDVRWEIRILDVAMFRTTANAELGSG